MNGRHGGLGGWILALDIIRGVALLALILLVIVGYTQLNDTNAKVGGEQAALKAQNGRIRSTQVLLMRSQALLLQAQQDVQQNASESCRIQARGLLAQRFLTGSLDDIHSLFTIPPTSDVRRQQARMPKRLLLRELRVVGDLNRNLAGYVAITRQQPHSRTCQP